MIHKAFMLFNAMGSEWVLVVLIAMSILVGAVVFQRWFEIRRLTRASQQFYREYAEAWFLEADTESWKKSLNEIKGNYACLEAEALDVLNKAQKNGTADPEKVVQAYLDQRRLKLEKHISVLGTIGSNGPFVGLLGTVLGIMRAFHDMSAQGGAGMENISSGISEALVATAIGLFVAIPAVVFFNLLNKRINQLIRRAENVSSLALSEVKTK